MASGAAIDTQADTVARPDRARDAARARDLPDALRVPLIGAVLVLLWNHDWLNDLADRAALGTTEGGSLVTQVLFVGAGLSMAAALWRLGLARLRPLAAPPLLLCAGWLGVTALTSVDPLLSLRRLTLFAIAALLSAGVLAVARSPRQLALTMAAAAVVILASCYLAVAFVPHLAVHTAFDANAEANHVGLWRGVFPHKNEAGAAMVILAIVGLYVAAAANRFLGWLVVLLALGFLGASGSKTAILLLPVILATTALCRWLTGWVLRALLLLGPILALSVVSVGSVLVPPIQDALGAVMTDATFTGRAEIWEFAIENIMVRPWQGWGIGAFWLTERTMYGGSQWLGWVNSANHSHNAYLDAALIGGFPLLAITAVTFMLMPLRDLQRIASGRRPDAETMLFLRLWFLGLVSASFETVLYNGNNATCCMVMLAVAGLRLRTRYAVAADRGSSAPAV